MTDKYVPQAGDKVKWPHMNNPHYGSVRGVVDFIKNAEEEIAVVYIPPTRFQHGEDRRRRTRHEKRFDQLTLLERPEV
jgi:hypothetical protein